jgi:hypothetical protein
MPPENENLPPDFTDEELSLSVPVILERMIALGWVEHPTIGTRKISDLVFTPEGEIARRMYRTLLVSICRVPEYGRLQYAFNRLMISTPAGHETN